MIVCIDGINGTGKSTQAKALELRLKDEGIDCQVFHDPGVCETHESAQTLRELAKHGKWDGKTTRAMLYMAARCELVPLLQPYIDSDRVAILDRYTPSYYAYQHEAFSHHEDDPACRSVSRINSIFEACRVPAPDLTAILLLDPKTALERAYSASGRKDVFERRNVNFVANLQSYYQKISACLPIDGYVYAGNRVIAVGSVEPESKPLRASDVTSIILSEILVFLGTKTEPTACSRLS